jgi:hypothetical protein
MGSARLRHDHAWACASVVLDLVKHLMREECHRDAHEAFYTAIMGCLEHFETEQRREEARLRPSSN